MPSNSRIILGQILPLASAIPEPTLLLHLQAFEGSGFVYSSNISRPGASDLIKGLGSWIISGWPERIPYEPNWFFNCLGAYVYEYIAKIRRCRKESQERKDGWKIRRCKNKEILPKKPNRQSSPLPI